ncbi:MAG: nucleotide sugar dehydrogenase [Candidatus Methylomirabilales bacterium]
MASTIAILGLGRVGLPLALAFAESGVKVFGIDVCLELIELLQNRQMPFIEEGAQTLLEQHLGKNFIPTDRVEVLKQAHSIIITLGTPVDEHMNPILSQIEGAVRGMAPFLKEGQLICLRSTVSPGTTEYIGRVIERLTTFKVGQDFFLAFCPERIAEGKSLEEFWEVPQIVGGLERESTKRATDLFKRIVSIVLETEARSAELAKLFCNMYRYIDFAIANEFMMIAHEHECDIYEIIDLVNRDYKRGGLKPPGLTAGPCLYKDGFFLVNRVPFTELIVNAWKINEAVPIYLIDQIKKIKPIEGAKIAILGLTFKKNIDDTRNSLSFKIKKILHAEGADVRTHDPYVNTNSLESVLENVVVVIIAMNHDFYRTLSPKCIKILADKDAIVCDIWNLFGTGKILFKLSDIHDVK